MLSLYVGFFLFIGATDLLPHAHEHGSVKKVFLTLAGFVFVFVISLAGAR
jgi:zinc transporter ZupT